MQLVEKKMKIRKIINDNSFVQARIIVYAVTIFFFLYIVVFHKVQCIGCPLCGMTRGVLRILCFDFKGALEFNNKVCIFFIIIPLIIIDLINIVIYKVKNKTQ